jgi:hypothetical protein
MPAKAVPVLANIWAASAGIGILGTNVTPARDMRSSRILRPFSRVAARIARRDQAWACAASASPRAFAVARQPGAGLAAAEQARPGICSGRLIRLLIVGSLAFCLRAARNIVTPQSWFIHRGIRRHEGQDQ